MKNRILRLLNIYPSEVGIVSNLFTIQFFLVSGSAFLYLTGSSIFLARLSVSQLPLALILTGAALLLFNKLVQQASSILTNRVMMVVVIVFCALVTALLALVNYTEHPRMALALFVWFNVVILLLESVFWGLVATVFNVREGRRLFTLIGAGDIPAELIGYITLLVLAPVIGLSNMMWITVAFFVMAWWFSRRVFESKRITESLQKHQIEKTLFDRARHKNDRGFKLILTIAGLSLVTYASIALIDYLFLAEVNQKYDTDLDLAYFLGMFFAGGRILAIFIKFILSSRFLNYAGLTGSLLLTPVVVLVFLTLIFISRDIFQDMEVLLYLIGIMTLLSEILRSTIQEPVTLILFQPLRIDLRLKGHTIAQGYTNALGITIIGMILYFMHDPASYWIYLLYLLAGLILIWILCVFAVKREYMKNLQVALSRGYLSGNSLFLEDQATIELLLGKTESEQRSEVVFALDQLEKGEYIDLDELFRRVLDRHDPILTDYVLERIEYNDMDQFRSYLLDYINHNRQTGLAAKYLKTIARLEPEDELLWEFVYDHNPEIRNAALTGLCINHNIDYSEGVRNRLSTLSASENEKDRISVARIIGESGNRSYADMLQDFLNDDHPEVVRSALHSLGRIRALEFIPQIVSMVHLPGVGKHAIMALASMDVEAIDYFRTHPSPHLKPWYINAAAHMTSETSNEYLTDLLIVNDRYFSLIVEKLRLRGFRAEEGIKEVLNSLIRARVTDIHEIVNLSGGLDNLENADSCQSALKYEVETRYRDIIKLIDMVYGDDKVKQAVRILLKDHQHSNAMEMLEHSISRDIFQRLSRALELLKHRNFPVRTGNTLNILSTIVSSKKIIFNDWTRAVALKLASEHHMASIYHIVDKEKDNWPPILKELIDLPILE